MPGINPHIVETHNLARLDFLWFYHILRRASGAFKNGRVVCLIDINNFLKPNESYSTCKVLVFKNAK